jgi:hypothetical protein
LRASAFAELRLQAMERLDEVTHVRGAGFHVRGVLWICHPLLV